MNTQKSRDNRSLATPKQRDYEQGLRDGRYRATQCNDWDDVTWCQKVTFDNLWDTRPHYVAGYMDGFK